MAARNIQKIFVGNLPWTVGQRELRNYFSEFGHIATAHVVFDKNSGMSRGYGFVQFGTRDGYNSATNKPQHFLEGTLIVHWFTVIKMAEGYYEEQAVNEIEHMFNRAANHLRSLTSKMEPSQLLEVYGYYKQATEGPCNVPKPGFFDFKGRQKWEAWNEHGNLDSTSAMERYVQLVQEADPNWDCYGEGDAPRDTWISVSCMANTDEHLDDNDKTIFDWVKEGNMEKVSSIIGAGSVSKDVVDEEGLGLIHWAADRGNIDILNFLLDNGVPVNLTDKEKQTPLHYAASCGHKDVVRVLLERGANPSLTDDEGLSPLDIAMGNDIKVLLEKS